MTTAPALPDRFWQKVSKAPSGCWTWTGGNRRGYGAFWLNGGMRAAHRVAYEAERGPVPPGLGIDHLCRNRACINPAHLEPVTRRENVLRGAVPNRDTCGNGHPWTTENVYRRSCGNLRCRACHREFEPCRRAKGGRAA